MDLRYALRTLSRTPGFTIVEVLTLALGIGINTIVFTIYGAVALKPIAARAPGELVRITGDQLFTFDQYQQIRRQTRSFTDVIATSEPQTIVGRMAQPEVFRARMVSGNYFSALGVTPRLGRELIPEDRDAVVLSYEFWAHKMQSDPSVLTRTILVNGLTLHVAGVAPERFAATGVPPQMPDLWIPLAAQAQVMPGSDW